MAEAIRNAIRHWDGLILFVDDPPSPRYGNQKGHRVPLTLNQQHEAGEPIQQAQRARAV